MEILLFHTKTLYSPTIFMPKVYAISIYRCAKRFVRPDHTLHIEFNASMKKKKKYII